MIKKRNSDNYYAGDRVETIALLPDEYNNVLEIGCGDGGYVSNLDSNCNYYAVEPQFITLKYKDRVTKVFRGTLDDVFDDLPDNFFDLVICNDVIEMFTYEDFFQKIKQKITVDGYIMGSIPNVRHISNMIGILFHKDWKYCDTGILDRDHMRFYTEKSLLRYFDAASLKVVKFTRLNKVVCNKFTIKCFLEKVLIFILGMDTKYVQFGFLCKVDN